MPQPLFETRDLSCCRYIEFGTLPAEGAAAAAAAPPGAAAREAVPAIDCGHGRKIPCLKLIKAGQSSTF